MTSPDVRGLREPSCCHECGERAVSNYRRLDDTVGAPLRIALVVALALGAGIAVMLGMFWLFAGLVLVSLAVMFLPRLLGVRWWGGTRCAACGHVRMFR